MTSRSGPLVRDADWTNARQTFDSAWRLSYSACAEEYAQHTPAKQTDQLEGPIRKGEVDYVFNYI